MARLSREYRRKKYANRIFIIGEAGVNHNGSLNIAKRLIDVAVTAGCDAVKFQTFKAENIATPGSQFDMLKRLELSWDAHRGLAAYCKRKNIIFISTPFDEESADFLHSLGMKIFKIASGEITNKPLVQRIAAKKRHIILSTGMSDLSEVQKAVKWIYEIWKSSTGRPSLTLLHCVSNYPTCINDVNLKAMKTLEHVFKLPVGYSDHTLGIEIPIAAAAMGAKVIEKHFTLDRKMKGPDHASSLQPRKLTEMVKAVRGVEKALGDGIKKPAPGEKKIRKIARRSLVAARDIKAGNIITPKCVAIKRPGTGLPPEFMERIINKRTCVDIKKNSLLRESFLSDTCRLKRG